MYWFPPAEMSRVKIDVTPRTMLIVITEAPMSRSATVWFGEAAVTQQACDAAEAISPGHCTQQHASDEDYWKKIWYWTTPQADCHDQDEATTCKTQDDWVSAWTALRGA